MMDVLRYMYADVKNTGDFHIGDRIVINQYTATCQEVNGNVAVFCMDQYLDEPMRMNGETYETSELRKEINSESILSFFPEEIRSKLVPFENGDLVRIPYAEELFSPDDIWFDMEHSNKKQWSLMKDRKNRICFRKNKFEWGWLMNKVPAAYFAIVSSYGDASYDRAANSEGVRLVFQLSLAQDTSTIIGGDIYENNETIDSKSDGHGKTGKVDCK